MLLLWAAVALFPLIAALVMGAIHADYDCSISDDDTAITLFLFDFLVFPVGAATVGFLAGWETWRPRGRGWAVVGASVVASLSLVWGFVAFWTTFLTIVDAACY
jgi:hypothetical protein